MPPPREVKLAGSVLKINDYPIFPRCIEYRGEKLAFLKQLGFNTIWLRQTPSPAFLAEARQLGLWLVCPPPELPGQADPQATIGPEFEPVLVWDLGHGLTGESLDANRQRAERVRLADSRVSRPLICAPINNLRSYSRHINLLLIDRRPLGTSLEMPDYGTWVRRQPLLALPGTPVWTTVQTQAGEGLRRQFAALSAGPGAAHGRRPRADPAAGLHGHLLRKPRPAVPFRLLAGGPGRRNAAAGDDAATAEPGTRSHRTLGGRRQHGRHGRVQPAAGQRRDPPRRSRADRHAHVAGPRLAMRGPARPRPIR